MGQAPNNFTIIKSITIIFVYVSQLKKNFLLFSLLSHTLINFFKDSNTLLSLFYFLLHAQLSFDYLLISKHLPLGCSLNSLVCSFFFFLLHYTAHTYSAQTIFIYNLAAHHNPNISQIRSLSTIRHILLFQIGLVVLLS